MADRLPSVPAWWNQFYIPKLERHLGLFVQFKAPLLHHLGMLLKCLVMRENWKIWSDGFDQLYRRQVLRCKFFLLLNIKVLARNVQFKALCPNIQLSSMLLTIQYGRTNRWVEAQVFNCDRSDKILIFSATKSQLELPSSRVAYPNIQVCNMQTFIEPIGGSAPKFSGVSDLSRLLGKSSHSQTLSCPAQGSPVPTFRWLCSIIKYLFRAYRWVCSEILRSVQTFQSCCKIFLITKHVLPSSRVTSPKF